MNAEMLATILAGVLAVPILQVFKRITGIDGTLMAFVAYFLSWPIAAIALVVFTDLTWGKLFASPETLILHGSSVAAIAMVVYRVIADKMGLSGDAGLKRK